MKKNYLIPTAEIEILNNEDILTMSNGGENGSKVSVNWSDFK